MEYGTRDAGLETAAEASNEESCSGRSSSCGSTGSESSAATSDWPLDKHLAVAGLQTQQPLPSGPAALLLNSIYSLHALHSQQRLWLHDRRLGDDEPKADRQQDNEKDETSAAAELPMLSTWMLNAYTSMLGRLSALAASAAAALEPDTDTESRSSQHSSLPATHSLSRESSPSCSSLQKDEKQRKRSRAAGSGKRAKKKRTSTSTSIGAEQQCRQEAAASTSTAADSAATTAGHEAAAGGGGRKRGLQALQRVRYRYEREEYRCALCSYACTIEKAFERHLRAHARGTAHESRVSCAVCGADRSSELDLSKHMRRHRDNRYFCCDLCIFRTVQLKKLIQHRRMHTGEKPHLCPHCSYRSARRDNLRSHVRRVHKKENLYQDTFRPRAPNFLKRSQDAEQPDQQTTDPPQPHPRPSPTAEPLLPISSD